MLPKASFLCGVCSVTVYMHICMCMYVYVAMCMHVCVRVHVCVHACVYVSVPAQGY